MNLNLMKLCASALAVTAVTCGVERLQAAGNDACYSAFETYDGDDLELVVDAKGTHFALWSPEAQEAKVIIYPTDRNSTPVDTMVMTRGEKGVWRASVPDKLYGRFYTFSIKHNGKWLAETPGVWAKALGTNGERAAIIDFKTTDPEGWNVDKGPSIKNINDAVLYEMHHRDFSVHPSSGIVNKGKFLALTEHGTVSPAGDKTGIDHLKELGVTHVHILPSYDFNSVDETQLPSNRYNWGYDPVNYNTPEGSYSTNPADPQARIREMKKMVKSLHDAGIGVVMDVVYNHTALNDDSNFSLTAPGYYYRHRADGSYSDASGCGNETASEREQMRNFIVNSVKYWAKEYHIDGFRFDLMAIHDTTTMNDVVKALKEVNPDIFVYGEGWTAGDSPLPVGQRALKDNVAAMPGVAVFSDDIRDAVKGHYSDATDRGFATGKPGNEETVKIGIVGATAHPQVDYSKGNNSKKPYALAPTQVINYVSCHDDLMLTDKLAKSMPDADTAGRQRADKLAQTIIFTSQGTPFIFAGEEIFRDKRGVHNSYKSPDSINAIDWTLKSENGDIYNYYRELIALRKGHPAFRMTTADDVARHLVFDDVKGEPNLISYSLKDYANGDSWKEIKVVFNGSEETKKVKIGRGEWLVVARDGQLKSDGMGHIKGGNIEVAPCSALILAKEK
ncbi:MAG TPA: type I pullulanase [Muribaculum sp.]|jgi:pullulanase|uniref:type I pullulanase n=1 Tax=Heminiphilus faecis TaxID=2601703 RepID=UPI000EF5CA56|nr:type I pullulanase [Heminiphilus faecis]RLT76668.1 type I pullulanase [bacterium J10(2018)]HRF67594.1 type I pullulanase [Muribaculum sp.]